MLAEVGVRIAMLASPFVVGRVSNGMAKVQLVTASPADLSLLELIDILDDRKARFAALIAKRLDS